MNKEKAESFIKRYFIALIGLLGVIAIGGTTYIALPFTCLVWYTNQCHIISEQFGQVGDLFGGIANPIITFLALIALLYSIKIQKEELEKTSAALKQQNDYIAKQNFENTFFNLLKAINDLKTILISEKLNDLGATVFNEAMANQELDTFNVLEAISDIQNSGDAGKGYVGLIISTLELLNEHSHLDLNHSFYSRLLFRAQTNHEIFYLFLYGMRAESGKKIKPYLEKNAAFEEMDFSVFGSQITQELKRYDASAYGNT
jgi:uncharacterized membrane protein